MSFRRTTFTGRPLGQCTLRPRRSFDLSILHVPPVRVLLFSIAAVTATSAIILAALIWTGASNLSSAWEDVGKLRESHRILGLLESETSRLQFLIHRHINQPNAVLLSEILSLHGELLSTLRGRGAADPILSGSTDELRLLQTG